jgi:hypothetical protein
MLLFLKIITIIAFGFTCAGLGASQSPFGYAKAFAALATYIAIEYREKEKTQKKKISGGIHADTSFTAKYGSKTRWANVTGSLKDKILNGTLSIRASTTGVGCGDDPAYGEKKELVIEFSEPIIREIRIPESNQIEIK